MNLLDADAPQVPAVTVPQHSEPFSTLRTEYVGRGRWRLRAPFLYGHPEGLVTVPEGFVTDLDSVPRLPGIYWLFKGRSVRSAVVHDWLYAAQRGRAYADRVFRDAMRDTGVRRTLRWPIWLGVRLGGWGIYRRHGRAARTVQTRMESP